MCLDYIAQDEALTLKLIQLQITADVKIIPHPLAYLQLLSLQAALQPTSTAAPPLDAV